jgi:hypothetical protein
VTRRRSLRKCTRNWPTCTYEKPVGGGVVRNKLASFPTGQQAFSETPLALAPSESRVGPQQKLGRQCCSRVLMFGNRDDGEKGIWALEDILATDPDDTPLSTPTASINCAIDRVISCYTPTIKALAHAREKPLQFRGGADERIFIVTMKETPGQATLGRVEQEVEEISNMCSSSFSVSTLNGCSTEAALETNQNKQHCTLFLPRPVGHV